MVQSILLASSESPPSPPPSASTSLCSSQPSSQPEALPSSQGSSQGDFPANQGSLDFLSGLKEGSLSPSLRAHAYVTLGKCTVRSSSLSWLPHTQYFLPPPPLSPGKLCLQNEALAKKSIAHSARELLLSRHAPIRNNIVIVLCDLAVRYSTKVDPYISVISSCLKDQCYLVRKQTLTLLARLLQEDYIKWRGSLFFHFASSLVDPELSRFSEFCLQHLLLVRHPGMFYQHFVECIFFFNSYEKHKGVCMRMVSIRYMCAHVVMVRLLSPSPSLSPLPSLSSLPPLLFPPSPSSSPFPFYSLHSTPPPPPPPLPLPPTLPLPAVYNQFKQTKREKHLFSLKGKKKADSRMTIYTFLLSNMTDQQRFQLTAKLSQVHACTMMIMCIHTHVYTCPYVCT